MAYKIRKFLSLEEALSYAIEQIGDEAIEKATEKSSIIFVNVLTQIAHKSYPISLR